MFSNCVPGTGNGAFGGNITASGLWIPEAWGREHGGPTIWMNLLLKVKFKPPRSNKGVQGAHPHQSLSTRSMDSHHDAAPSPGVPCPQGLWGKYTAP